MGYTHYWSFKKAPRGKTTQIEKRYQKAIKECNKIIRYYSETYGGLSGFSAHVEPGTYGGVKVNGSQNSGQCEDFVLREHFSQNESFNFCKTRQYPYDAVVVACLIVLKHRLGDLIDVSSDGDAEDWTDGVTLANAVLGRFAVPKSIQCARGGAA